MLFVHFPKVCVEILMVTCLMMRDVHLVEVKTSQTAGGMSMHLFNSHQLEERRLKVHSHYAFFCNLRQTQRMGSSVNGPLWCVCTARYQDR